MDHRRLDVRFHLVLGLLAFAVLAIACQRTATPAPATDASAQLAQVIEEAWQRRIERDLSARLFEGLPVEHIPDLSFAEAQADAASAQATIEALDGIDSEALSHDEQLSQAILRWESARTVEALEYFWHQSTLTPYASPLSGLRQIFPLLPVASDQERARYVSLVRQAAAAVDQLREVVAGQLERGIVLARANIGTALGLIDASTLPAAAGPFAVSDERLEGVLGEVAAAFRADIAAAVDEAVNPALGRLRTLVAGPVSEAAPEAVGVAHQPGGEAYYHFLTRFHTTLDITPEAVHAIGLEMVAALEADMAAIRDELGFAGTREEFEQQLARDSRFYAKTPDEIGERLLAVAERMNERIGGYFLVEPAAPFGVRRLDPALEGAVTYGYYQPPSPSDPRGTYLYNGSQLDKRSLLSITGLALHELVPGHHFHIARQFENSALPAFRRQSFATAYTEGWGSYASFLGLEAGLAEDPYDRYGIYTLEVFLASRLVVDPGMNLLGWSLDEARAYMGEHTLESASQIASETLRYATDLPGQGLAYQMGKRKLIELRTRAGAALGERFDLRRFHEAVLGPGAMPLAVLEQHIAWWIEQEKAR